MNLMIIFSNLKLYGLQMSLSSYLKASLLVLLVLTSTSLSLTSCKALGFDEDSDIDNKELPKWTITVNELVKYPRASLGEKEIPTFTGTTIWVRKHYEFNSKSVEKVTAVPTDNLAEFNLRLKLNKHGSLIAMRLCNEKIHPPWGISIDGVFYSTIKVTKAQDTKVDDYSQIIIEASFNKELTDAVVKYSEPNYKHFHPDGDKN